jgi:uncharacterized protein DUF4286
MLIYNVTTKVKNSIADEWLSWLKEEHIPELIKTGCFTHAVILHLAEVDDAEGRTYAVQYHTANMELYNCYIEQYADAMRKKTIDKWEDKFISFRTIMEIVN